MLYKKLILAIILISLLAFLLPVSIVSADEVVTFPDPNLEAAIREAIGKPSGDIYQSDLVGLTSFTAESRSITNLAGLEHCTGLTYLYLWDNQISSIWSLSNLTGLTELYLAQNQISSISPLSGLTSLIHLNLGGNHISSLSPLSGLILLALRLFGRVQPTLAVRLGSWT